MVSERVGTCAEKCCNLRLRLKPVSDLMFCNGTDCFVIALVSESCLAPFKKVLCHRRIHSHVSPVVMVWGRSEQFCWVEKLCLMS